MASNLRAMAFLLRASGISSTSFVPRDLMMSLWSDLGPKAFVLPSRIFRGIWLNGLAHNYVFHVFQSACVQKGLQINFSLAEKLSSYTFGGLASKNRLADQLQPRIGMYKEHLLNQHILKHTTWL